MMDNREAGRVIGEKAIRRYLELSGADPVFQVDFLALFPEEWRSIEAKYQEIYEPPPFYGHGLPLRQVRDRMRLYHDKGIVPYLCVMEKGNYGKKDDHILIWEQSLVVLEQGRHIDTNGPKFRRIYDIAGFEREYVPINLFPDPLRRWLSRNSP